MRNTSRTTVVDIEVKKHVDFISATRYTGIRTYKCWEMIDSNNYRIKSLTSDPDSDYEDTQITFTPEIVGVVSDLLHRRNT